MHYDDFKTAKPLAIEALQIDSQPEPQILLGILQYPFLFHFFFNRKEISWKI